MRVRLLQTQAAEAPTSTASKDTTGLDGPSRWAMTHIDTMLRRIATSQRLSCGKALFFARYIAFDYPQINRSFSSQRANDDKRNATTIETQHPSTSDTEYAKNLEIRMSTAQLDFDEV